MNLNVETWLKSSSWVRALLYGTMAGLFFFVGALIVGMTEKGFVATISLIGVGIALEAQPGAVASIPIGFSPLTGAAVSILANCICLPLLILLFHQIIHRWTWMGRKMQKAERFTQRHGRYGVWILIPLCPVLGAYVCLSLALGMQWRLSTTLVSVMTGLIASTFILTYFGNWIWRLFHG